MGKHGAKIGTTDAAIAVQILLDETGLTQTELARRSELRQSTISQIKSGKSPRPSAEVMQKIANGAGRPLDLGGKEALNMKNQLERFLRTKQGKSLNVNALERKELLRRRWFRATEEPPDLSWVKFIEACRGLPEWRTLTSEAPDASLALDK